MATNNSINSRELIKTNNLSDLTNTTTARTNLGMIISPQLVHITIGVAQHFINLENNI
jgi:hypothetical protein